MFHDITDRKRAEEELRESNDRYRAFFDHGPDGVVILDPETGRIVEFNDRACRQLGYSREEFGRLRVSDIEVTAAHIQRITREGHDDFDTQQRTKQGEVRDVHVTAQVIEAGRRKAYHCVWRDITEHKSAERALQQSEKKYREFVESVNSIILRMDPLGNVSYLNKFAQEFFGYEEPEIIGKNVIGTIVPETDSSGQDLRAMIEDIGKHPEAYAANENENICKDGRRVWIVWTNKPLRSADGQVKEILCVGNDVTERRRLEDQLRQAQKMESVGRLAGGVAHDFNNMLGVILGHTEMAMEQIAPSQPLHADLEEIRKAAVRSADLTPATAGVRSQTDHYAQGARPEPNSGGHAEDATKAHRRGYRSGLDTRPGAWGGQNGPVPDRPGPG